MLRKGRRIGFSNIIFGFIYTLAIITAIIFGLYMYKNQYSFFVEINEISISLGEKYKIEIIAEQENKAIDYEYIYKSKDQDIVSVDSEGYITPNKVGIAEVEITSKKSFSKEKIVVNVLETGVETITFNGDIKLKIKEIAKCYPIINGDTSIVAKLTYKSEDESIAKVDEEGNITALSEGRTHITATANNGVTGSLLVIVESETIEVVDLSLEPSQLTLNVGDSKNLTAKVLPIDATNQSLIWISSNSSIVNVTQAGIITAKKEGTASIVVKTTNGLTKTANITVKVPDTKVSATGITLNSNVISLKSGETYPLKATISPSNTTDQNITWTSSDVSIATVNVNGVVTGNKAGTITITAKTSNGKTATCSVTVYEENIDVADVGLSQTSTTLDIGNSITLVATVLPNNATNKTVSWSSSDSSIVEVNQNGVITAKKAGTATITVTTTNGKTKQCIVTVPAQKVLATAVSLNKTAITIDVGKNEELTATISPSNTTDKNITWISSDASIATVNVNGVITGKKVGTATITAKTSNGKTATCSVTVREENIDVTEVGLSQTSTTLDIGNSITLVATVLPNNATNKSVNWSSSDSSIVEVTQKGVITAKKAGTATITVTTTNGKTKQCIVTVPAQKVLATAVSLNKTAITIDVGKNEELIVTITPSNTTDKNITWTSSNASIATVSNGKVTGKKAGIATITAKTSNGKTATCKVTVQNPTIYATSVSLSNVSLKLSGGSYTLTATVSPSNTTDKTVTWTSSNPNVATVDSSGKVVAKSTGTSTITVKTSNGKIATCIVTVQSTFTNPVKYRAADPWAYKHTDGYYYIMWSSSYCGHKDDGQQNRVKIYRTKDLSKIPEETATNAYQWIDNNSIHTVADSYNCIWAPEIHYINGYWYIYYSDTPKGDRAETSNRRMYVIKSKTSNPWGEYYSPQIIRGIPSAYQIQDNYAIDGTVLNLNNQLYFLWSSKDMSKGRNDPLGVQSIYIASMQDPFTLSSQASIISYPIYSWEGTLNSSGNFECSCSNVDNCCADDNNEGPQVLKDPDGNVHVMYSANAANMHYKIGMITYRGGNPLSASSWLKYSKPLFQSGNGVYGPGHAGFTTSPDGKENWIIYHGYSTFGAGWGERHMRIQSFTWLPNSEHGYIPNFDSPVKEGTSLNKPSGTSVE